MLPAEFILGEHYRLGSRAAILSRSFCNIGRINDYQQIERIFHAGIADIRRVEQECAAWTEEQFRSNHEEVIRRVENILEGL